MVEAGSRDSLLCFDDAEVEQYHSRKRVHSLCSCEVKSKLVMVSVERRMNELIHNSNKIQIHYLQTTRRVLGCFLLVAICYQFGRPNSQDKTPMWGKNLNHGSWCTKAIDTYCALSRVDLRTVLPLSSNSMAVPIVDRSMPAIWLKYSSFPFMFKALSWSEQKEFFRVKK